MLSAANERRAKRSRNRANIRKCRVREGGKRKRSFSDLWCVFGRLRGEATVSNCVSGFERRAASISINRRTRGGTAGWKDVDEYEGGTWGWNEVVRCKLPVERVVFSLASHTSISVPYAFRPYFIFSTDSSTKNSRLISFHKSFKKTVHRIETHRFWKKRRVFGQNLS